MTSKAVWTYQECDRCEGFGIEYCMICEDRCDHDQLCRSCKGNGEIPQKIIPIIAFGVWLNKPKMRGIIAIIDKEIWPTRGAAQKELDTYDARGHLR